MKSTLLPVEVEMKRRFNEAFASLEVEWGTLTNEWLQENAASRFDAIVAAEEALVVAQKLSVPQGLPVSPVFDAALKSYGETVMAAILEYRMRTGFTK